MEQQTISLPTLNRWMDSDDFVQRAVAMKVLAQTPRLPGNKEDDFIILVQRGLADPHPTVQAAAYEAAATHLDMEGFNDLALQGLRNQDPIVREKAIKLLDNVPSDTLCPTTLNVAMSDEATAKFAFKLAADGRMLTPEDVLVCLTNHHPWWAIKPYEAVQAVEGCKPFQKFAESWMHHHNGFVKMAALSVLAGERSEGAKDLALRFALDALAAPDADLFFWSVRVLAAQDFDDYNTLLEGVREAMPNRDNLVAAICKAASTRLQELRQEWSATGKQPASMNKLTQLLTDGLSHLDYGKFCRKALMDCGFELSPLRDFDPGDKTVYKYCLGNVLVTATIPADAYVLGHEHAFVTNKANVTMLTGTFGGEPLGIDPRTWTDFYIPGQTTVSKDFDPSAPLAFTGLTFFSSLEDAKKHRMTP